MKTFRRLRAFQSALTVFLLLLGFSVQNADAVAVDTTNTLGLDGATKSETRVSDRPSLDRALRLIDAGKPAEAEAVVRSVIERGPDSAASYEILGAALALQDRIDEAINALQRAIDINPRQHTAWTKLGDISRAIGDEAKAVSFYRRALEIAPEDRLANQRIGLYLAERGEIESAIRHLENGLVGAPAEYLGIRADLAALHLRRGKPEQALDVLARWEEQAEEGATVDAAALRLLGDAQLATGRPDLAIERYRALLRTYSDDIPALIGLGRAERSADRLEDSIETLRRAAAIRPDDPMLQIELALSEAAIGDGASAEARLDGMTAEERHPQPEVLASAARLYGAMGRYEKAREGLARAIAQRPEDPGYRGDLAVVLVRLGDHAAALAEAEARLELMPADPNAAFMVGMLQETAGDRAGAIKTYRHALEASPEHWPSLNNLAVMLLANGEVESALDLAGQASRLAPENANVLDTLASAYERSGDVAALMRTYERMAEVQMAAGQREEARKTLQKAAGIAPSADDRTRIMLLIGDL